MHGSRGTQPRQEGSREEIARIIWPSKAGVVSRTRSSHTLYSEGVAHVLFPFLWRARRDGARACRTSTFRSGPDDACADRRTVRLAPLPRAWTGVDVGTHFRHRGLRS